MKIGLQKEVESIIRRTGEIILSYRFKKLSRVVKPGAGFVTEADLAAEEFLIKELSKIEPGIAFFAEENGKSNQGSSDYCWVIDPLDGTTNFAYGLPHFCISVALTHKNKPMLGFVYQPLLNEMFFAQEGKGAFLNGSPLKVSGVKRIEDAFLLFCIPYGKNAGSFKLFEHVLQLSQKAYSMRLLGAAALDQSYVGAGRLDGMFFEQLSWWDVAAGSLIIQEAGGKVSDYKGNPIKPGFKSFIAGNPWIHELLVQELG
jgi:myo-inositol-1(or 4)-monophosphatase